VLCSWVCVVIVFVVGARGVVVALVWRCLWARALPSWRCRLSVRVRVGSGVSPGVVVSWGRPPLSRQMRVRPEGGMWRSVCVGAGVLPGGM